MVIPVIFAQQVALLVVIQIIVRHVLLVKDIIYKDQAAYNARLVNIPQVQIVFHVKMVVLHVLPQLLIALLAKQDIMP